jgi:hypothetical protein
MKASPNTSLKKQIPSSSISALFAMFAIATTTTDAALSLLVDFGKSALTTDTGSGTRWNDVSTTSNNVNIPNPMIANAIDVNGVLTGITLNETSAATSPANYGIAGADFNSSTSTVYPLSSTRDSMYVVAGATIALTLGGLNDSLLYELTLFSAHPSQSRTAEWEIDTVAQSLPLLNNTSNTIIFTDINSVGGEIEILFRGISGDANWSTLELTSVPEPSSTALLGLGGLALMLRRRR